MTAFLIIAALLISGCAPSKPPTDATPPAAPKSSASPAAPKSAPPAAKAKAAAKSEDPRCKLVESDDDDYFKQLMRKAAKSTPAAESPCPCHESIECGGYQYCAVHKCKDGSVIDAFAK